MKAKKLRLEKFELFKLKNKQSIFGGNNEGGDGGDTGTGTLKKKCEEDSDIIIWE